MNLTIGIATRGRREFLEKTVINTLENVRNKGTKIVVLCDADDYKDGLSLPPDVIVDFREREDTIAGKWNRMMHIAPADVYMAMCNYRYQITPGFDEKIIKAASVFPDGIGCVVQHLANLSFPAHQAVTSKMVDVMGYFYVEHFPYWFVDHWLDDIYRMIGRFSYVDCHTEIFQRTDGTQEFREPRLWATLYDSLYKEREELAEKLFKHMDEPEWRKEMLRTTWPMIHSRSRMLNSMVREMHVSSDFDERYLRVREKAAKRLLEIYEKEAG